MRTLLALILAVAAVPALATDKDAGWKERVGKLFADPNARASRTCSPETGRCTSQVRSGKAHASILEGKGGVALLRILCVFNDTDDRRRCVDWDNDVGFEEVKTAKGWVPAR